MKINLIQEMQECIDTLYEDPITERNKYLDTLTQVSLDFDTINRIASDTLIRSFLSTVFRMFTHEDENFSKCAEILIKLSKSNRDISSYSDFIREMGKHENFKSDSITLLEKSILDNTKRKDYEDSDHAIKRIKLKRRVSFSDKIETRFFEPTFDHRLNNDEPELLFVKEKETVQSVNSNPKIKNIIPWKKPKRLEEINCVVIKETEERKRQIKRESNTVKIMNNSLYEQSIPTEEKMGNSKSKVLIETKIIPLHNLGVKNVWKRLDFIKIIESKDLNLEEILNDPKILENFFNS